MNNADIVLKSRAIFTGNEEQPFAGGLAISGNKIVAVLKDETIQSYITDETTVYEYGDQLIMPGFYDFHVHLFAGSLSEQSVLLHAAKSEEEAAQMVKVFADAHPEDEWIFGFRWYHIYWDRHELPTKSTLDRLIPDRPVFLFNDECHGAWLNSKALDILGITKDSENPPFGEIVKDEYGEPTGFLYETAMGFAQQAFDSLSESKRRQLLQTFLEKAASYGVTSVSDMLPLPGLSLGDLEMYRTFEEEGTLTTRIHFMSALDGDLNQPKHLRDTYKTDKLKFNGLKQFLDGVPIAYTALLVEPYSDKQETIGDTLIPSDVVREWVVEADKEGFRVRLHACGDGAVRLGLDCYEAAQIANGVRDSRHTIEHIEVIHETDLPRVAQLGVIASMQPEHLAAAENFNDNVYVDRLGKEREPLTWPIRTLQDQGVAIAFGTDFPVVGLDPWLEIYRAVTRKHDDGLPEEGWNAKEKISLQHALQHYTKGSAHASFTEDRLGTLEVGKLADVIVLKQNPFTSSESELKEIKTALTIMDGKVVYEA
ncbi:amidohydrolase [Geomicrobium sediminis]|uniref:Amidohydrolase YtcJ n=1 Tax=Geomicrobium sediminis TaxID=1347788 RepID=A0ABS2PGT6_9BACL|nr:amidohydrolase [Geomicrobium sediminis]MBM7634161.1 putative amidohydrolase YtcJ [Geomicrobium sediminis]